MESVTIKLLTSSIQHRNQVPGGLVATAVSIVFISALFGAGLPLYFFTTSETSLSTLILYGNPFAAGVLAAAGFVHLIPDGDRALLSLFPAVRYPFAGLLALLGGATVFVLDFVMKNKLLTMNNECCKAEERGLLGSKVVDTGRERSVMGVHMLTAALSLHSLIEGMTLGASVLKRGQFVAVLISIVAHKMFAAVSLGTSLAGVVVKGGGRGKVGAFMCVLVFALLTPIGATGGVMVVEWLDDRMGSVVSAGLNCLSGGIFVYVGFVELLTEGGSGDENVGVGSVGVFLLAGGLMSLLAVWT